MSVQLQGLTQLVTAARLIVPPQLDFVILVYMPDGELKLTSVMYPVADKTPLQQFERAKEAARAFLETKPHPSFNPQS